MSGGFLRPARIAVEDAESVFAEASAHFQAGAFDQAAELCRALQASFPKHAAVLHLFGLVQLRRGLTQEAREKLARAVKLAPDDPELLANYAGALAESGRPILAVEQYRRALAIDADNSTIAINLVLALRATGRLDEAADGAAQFAPRFTHHAEFNRLRGEIEAARGNLPMAATAYDVAARAAPDDPAIQTALGWSLIQLGHDEAALLAFQRWVDLAPEDPEAHDALGQAFQKLRRWDEAIAAHFTALKLSPRRGSTLLNLGAALSTSGRFAEAEAVLRKAMEVPEVAIDAEANLGNLRLRSALDIDAARTLYESVLARAPAHRTASIGLAQILIARGEVARGFDHLDARFAADPLGRQVPEALAARPRWRGEPIAGRSILLHFEQGFGDTIQFMRFAPRVAMAGARATLLVPPPLEALARRLEMPGLEVAARIDSPLAFDAHCPLMSLPAALGLTRAELGRDVPYLHADGEAEEAWRARLGAEGGLKVGLAWSGNPEHADDLNRSMRFADLASILGIARTRVFSLQLDIRESDREAVAAFGRLTELGPEFADFSATAAAIAALDLVIAVDTAVAHVAGALGKPTWLLLAYLPDWRWLDAFERTPWYPTMRVFRQTSRGDWAEPVARVALALADRASVFAAAAKEEKTGP
jgi:Flp pilus assembly protein TadD